MYIILSKIQFLIAKVKGKFLLIFLKLKTRRNTYIQKKKGVYFWEKENAIYGIERNLSREINFKNHHYSEENWSIDSYCFSYKLHIHFCPLYLKLILK